MESIECLPSEDREIMRMALQRFRLRGRTVQRNTKMRNPLAMKLQLVFFLAVITCSCSGFAVTDRSDRAVVQTSSREQRSSTEERPLKVKEQQSKVLSADRFVNFLLPGDDQQQQQQQQRPFVISMQTEKPPTEDSEKAKAEAEADDTSDESSPSASSETEKDSELLFKHRRRAQARASLMAKRDRGSSSESKSTGKDTSVGARRVGSATRSRQGGSATSQIWDAVRKTAQGASSASKNASNSNNITSSLFLSTASATQATRISKSVITTAIEDLLQSRGCIPVTAHSQSGTNQVAIRLATPHDDVDIANRSFRTFIPIYRINFVPVLVKPLPPGAAAELLASWPRHPAAVAVLFLELCPPRMLYWAVPNAVGTNSVARDWVGGACRTPFGTSLKWPSVRVPDDKKLVRSSWKRSMFTRRIAASKRCTCTWTWRIAVP